MSTTIGLYIVKGQCDIPLEQPIPNCLQDNANPSILRPDNGFRYSVYNDRSTFVFDERVCSTAPQILVSEAPYEPSEIAREMDMAITGRVSPPVNYDVWKQKLEMISIAFFDRQIKAISTVPTNPHKLQSLYIDKLERDPNSDGFLPSRFVGYIQPYVGRLAAQNPRDAHPHRDYPIDYLRGPGDIERSVRDCLDSVEKQNSTKPLLASFLLDPETDMVALTFADRTTHIWGKLSS